LLLNSHLWLLGIFVFWAQTAAAPILHRIPAHAGSGYAAIVEEEEEYRRLAKHPDYQSLFKEVDLTTAAEAVHNGYF